ncbi:MAG: hypothetical protein IPK74_09355 [Deltaproteobacteria bacterium]|nr:hypothetical protein [Deltaproteobacteria bacterium]
MIIVTGTKRSGTSMWMQILTAAGLPAFGEAFPRVWENTIKDANPDGFYESILRRGIYWATNPHPRTGDYFFPEQVENHIVKVFIPGLVRTDRAFIGHVVATMRPWREYEASLARLYDMEDAKRLEQTGQPPPPRIPSVLEWWHENFSLVRDIVTRRHRVHVQSYDGLLRDPEKVIAETIKWLGRGDAEAAAKAVKPGNRTQKQPESSAIEPEFATVFDELYAVVDERQAITAPFIQKLNQTNLQLAPRMAQAQKDVANAMQRLRRERGASHEPDEDVEAQPSW